jgi:hypothetical protein
MVRPEFGDREPQAVVGTVVGSHRPGALQVVKPIQPLAGGRRGPVLNGL